MNRRPFRILIITPIFVGLVAVGLALSPVLFLIAGVMSLATGGWRPARAVAFVLLYGIYDVIALLAGFAIWLRLAGRRRTPDDPLELSYYDLMGWLLNRLSAYARSILGIHVTIQGDEAERALRSREGPLIVLSRHAGPGDSFLIVNEILTRGRRPLIVLRSALQLDPAIDLLGHRLRFVFVTKGASQSADARQRIGRLSQQMDDSGALLLFPEGGNFTPERRRQSIRYLLRRGRRRHARQAADMNHVVAPRAGGVLAALSSAPPNTSVIFVAHTGLAGMSSHLWQRLPLDTTLACRMWLVDAGYIPRTEKGQTEWLYDWWGRIDEWVRDAAKDQPPPAALQRVRGPNMEQ